MWVQGMKGTLFDFCELWVSVKIQFCVLGLQTVWVLWVDRLKRNWNICVATFEKSEIYFPHVLLNGTALTLIYA